MRPSQDEVGSRSVPLEDPENRHRKAVDRGSPEHAQAVAGHTCAHGIGGKWGEHRLRRREGGREAWASGAAGDQEERDGRKQAEPGSRPETEAPRS